MGSTALSKLANKTSCDVSICALFSILLLYREVQNASSFACILMSDLDKVFI